MKKTAILLVILLLLPVILCGCSSKGETVFDYNGYKISEKVYQYYLSTIKTNILSHYGLKDTDEFWNEEIADGKSAEEYYTGFIDGIVKDYCVAQSLFREYGLKLDADTKKAIEDDINEKIDFSGSRAELNAELSELGINIGILKDIYTMEAKYNAVYEYLFGENGSLAASSSQVEEFYEKNYSRMKYIVLYTTELLTDEKGNPTYDQNGQLQTRELTAEEMKAKRDLADSIKAEASGKDPEVFEGLMTKSEYSTESYPGGFYVSVNELDVYGSQIFSALQKMEIGDVEIIEEAECIYLIRKYDLPAFEKLDEQAIDQLASLQAYASQEIASELFTEYEKNVTVNEEVKGKYSLREVAANKYYNF